jgi:hypothetical protein
MLAKRFILVVLLACLVLPAMVGCGVGSTVQENNRTIARVWDLDSRMLTDDVGLLLLARRPFHGSRYPIK